MTNHYFDFDGGEFLTKMGASWFVSYAYYSCVDKTEKHWEKVKTVASRRNRFNTSGKYHEFWLKQVLQMNESKLTTNAIELNAKQIKEMANEILQTKVLLRKR